MGIIISTQRLDSLDPIKMAKLFAKEKIYCPVHPRVLLDCIKQNEGSCPRCWLRYDLDEAQLILGFCQRNGFKAKQKLIPDTGPLSFITWGVPRGGIKRKELVIVHRDGTELTDKEIKRFSRRRSK